MSRLVDLSEDAPPTAKRTAARSRHRHPEAVQAAHREAAAKRKVVFGPTPFGWLVVLYLPSGERRVRETTALATYETAKKIRDEEMRSGAYEKAWIVRKTLP